MKTTKIEIIFEIILPVVLIILCITEVIIYSVIHQWLFAALYLCCSGIWTATLTFNIQSLKLEKQNKELERIIEETEEYIGILKTSSTYKRNCLKNSPEERNRK